MMQSQRVGEKTELRADSLILPWLFILDGCDKAILTIIVGKIYLRYIKFIWYIVYCHVEALSNQLFQTSKKMFHLFSNFAVMNFII